MSKQKYQEPSYLQQVGKRLLLLGLVIALTIIINLGYLL